MFSLSGKVNIQIPRFPCAVATLFSRRWSSMVCVLSDNQIAIFLLLGITVSKLKFGKTTFVMITIVCKISVPFSKDMNMIKHFHPEIGFLVLAVRKKPSISSAQRMVVYHIKTNRQTVFESRSQMHRT